MDNSIRVASNKLNFVYVLLYEKAGRISSRNIILATKTQTRKGDSFYGDYRD